MKFIFCSFSILFIATYTLYTSQNMNEQEQELLNAENMRGNIMISFANYKQHSIKYFEETEKHFEEMLEKMEEIENLHKSNELLTERITELMREINKLRTKIDKLNVELNIRNSIIVKLTAEDINFTPNK